MGINSENGRLTREKGRLGRFERHCKPYYHGECETTVIRILMFDWKICFVSAKADIFNLVRSAFSNQTHPK